MAEPYSVVILDFGSQYTHLIMRRCRELEVYPILFPYDATVDSIATVNPKAIILSGSPNSVYTEAARHTTSEFWNYCSSGNLPVLGICYGMQEMQRYFGGEIRKGDNGEYGCIELSIVDGSDKQGAGKRHPMFEGIDKDKSVVWMSHGDVVERLAPGFTSIAYTELTKFAGIVHSTKPFWGVQFHPEVTHAEDGIKIIANFLRFANFNLNAGWNTAKFASDEIQSLRHRIGKRHVIGALSGGVDSTVAAALLYEAVGSQFHGFMVDTGLLRLNEGHTVIQRLREQFPGLQVKLCDAKDRFFDALKGVTCPEAKREVIGRLFIDVFVEACDNLKTSFPPGTFDGALLLQGTLYPDVIESVSDNGLAHTIKSHHNVGGLPKHMNLELLEPLRYLFKDEVRQLGLDLNLNKDIVWRHPFPGPGLAIRIIGEVTREYVEILRQADAIYLEHLRLSGHYDKIGQAFAVLLPSCRTVGVTGDQRTYGMTICLRAVQTSDFMTADSYELPYSVLKQCSSLIMNKIKEINRVCYDITSKPPGTIEWE